MSVLTIIIVIFSILGAIDYVIGNKFGLGKEFERGFNLLGVMALSMIGMIVITPFIADVLTPFFSFVHRTLGLDPSVIPASLFANDMGGAPLSVAVAKDEKIGLFNALVVSSMMGCTVSFSIPFALGVVKKEQHREVLLGMLCGIVTIPIGCFVSGLMCKLPLLALLYNLLPLIIFAGIISFGLIKFPDVCVKIFSRLAFFIKIIIVTGLVLGIIRFLSGKEIIKGLSTLEEGAMVCVNASVVMSGAFPFVHIVSKLLAKPLKALGNKIGINETSAIGLVSSLATSATTFGMMEKMDKKGVLLNSAFAVSAAFLFAGHLAFTMAFEESLIAPVMVGKIISGITALILATAISSKFEKVS